MQILRRIPTRRRQIAVRTVEIVAQQLAELIMAVIVAIVLLAAGWWAVHHVEIVRVPGECGWSVEHWSVKQVCEPDSFQLVLK